MTTNINGIIPVMLTPFSDEGEIDYPGLANLIEWYIAHGADALFAVCQSSEMQFLSLAERVSLARFVVERAHGRVPVIASGHVSHSRDDQLAELNAVAETGVAAIVLVTNRLDQQQAGDSLVNALRWLLDRLPRSMPLGLYECPAPYRRLLTDDELKFCIDTGRFVVLKDVSCDLPTVVRRVGLARGSPLAIVNANATIAFKAMQAGSRGFTGVFSNFHPDLYRWLLTRADAHSDLADDLATFLALAALAEPMGYPALAKAYHLRLGTFTSMRSRSITYDIRERFWALDATLDIIQAGTAAFRARTASA